MGGGGGLILDPTTNNLIICIQAIATACLAVAGPVGNNEVTMTNRGRWIINGDKVGMMCMLVGSSLSSNAAHHTCT